MYMVSFNHVSKSGKQINYNLFDELDSALQFSIQLCQCANVEFIGAYEVDVTKKHEINVCEELHGENGNYATIKK